MVEIKRFIKDIFLFGSGAAAGYTVNELKQRDKRRKIRLGVIGSMGTVYALYMTLNHLGPDYLNYRKELELMQEKHQYTIDSMRVEKGYDDPQIQFQEFNKKMDEQEKKINNIVPSIESKLEQDINHKVEQKVTQKINPLYDGQKKILEEISKKNTENTNKNISHNVNTSSQESKSFLDSIVDFFSTNDENSSSPTVQNYSRFMMNIDKSSNTLSLFGSDKKLLYSCPISLSRSGGPPSGQYKINTIAPRDGDLYPGVMKLTDIIVITGAGENDQYANAIRNRQNITKTGGRIETKDYNRIISTVKNNEVVVNVE